MPSHCCVPKCSQRGYKSKSGEKVSFLSSPHVVGWAYCSYSVSVLPSFLPSVSTIYQVSIGFMTQINVIKFVRRPTRDHRTVRQDSCRGTIYIQMVMTATNQGMIKLRVLKIVLSSFC